MEIICRPPTKITIHKLCKRDYNDFVHIHAVEGDGVPLWCNGILFNPYIYADVEFVIKERIERDHIHYSEITWCECPNFVEKLKRKDSAFEVSVINMGKDDYFMELTEWLKKQ